MSRLDELRRIADLVGIATRHVDALGVVARARRGDAVAADRRVRPAARPASGRRGARRRRPRGAVRPRAGPYRRRRGVCSGAAACACRSGPAAVEWHLPARRRHARAAGKQRCERELLRCLRDCRSAITGSNLAGGGATAEISLAVAPAFVPPAGDGLQRGARSWGLTDPALRAAQRARLGHRRFQRSGAFCAREAGSLGAAAVGINPLHALFAAEPRHFSPYSPSSRALARLSLYRRDRGPRLCRGPGGATPGVG